MRHNHSHVGARHEHRDTPHGWRLMGRHRGGHGFRGFHGGGHDDQGDHGHRSMVRGRKIGSDDLQLLLLLLLAERPSHGYELIRALEEHSGGFYVPSPGMIYPALTYLEELQHATVRVEGTRKLYELAPAGREHLERHRAAAESVMQQLQQFGRRMASFSSAAAAERGGRHRGGRHGDRTTSGRHLSLGGAVDEVLDRLLGEALGGRASQGELIYLLCRSLRARRVIDFATSAGVSTLYLAAAMRDNGGGSVISAERQPQEIEIARRNLSAAGLEGFVELRAGDARQTLRSLGEPIDFSLIDGCAATGGEPSLALEVFKAIAPQIRSGGLVLNDNAEPDYLAYVRDPANGFMSIALPLNSATELSLKQ